MRDDPIADWRLFLRVVEAGGIAAVAVEMRTEASTVSRRLAALERRLSVRLVQRSTRRSTPTEAGRLYYERLRHILEEVDALEAEVRGEANGPSGLLRVSAPVDFGALFVGPWLLELHRLHDGLRTELLLDDRYVDLVGQGIDVAIRIGRLADSGHVARRLGAMTLVLVATDSYLDRRGRPEQPDDLEDHDFVLYSWLQARDQLALTGPDGATARVRAPSRFAVNSAGAAVRVVEAGGGVHAAPLWLVADALAAGRLERVLPGWSPPTYDVHALYTGGRHVPARVRALVDHLVAKTSEVPGMVR
ncbi:MAG TPA: LysR family transcriptional regulator [Microvirga sp.]|jgi:DNA-binding transcriptional LysR family regulator|nr:LysR family transcriptional regulator [Microvirga sp.]